MTKYGKTYNLLKESRGDLSPVKDLPDFGKSVYDASGRFRGIHVKNLTDPDLGEDLNRFKRNKAYYYKVGDREIAYFDERLVYTSGRGVRSGSVRQRLVEQPDGSLGYINVAFEPKSVFN